MAISVRNAQTVAVSVSVAGGFVALVQVDLDDVSGANRVQITSQDWVQQDFNDENPQVLDLTADIAPGRTYWVWLLASALPGVAANISLDLLVDGVAVRRIALSGQANSPSQMARYIQLRS